MQGQANHFYRYAPEKIQYGIDRYINETRRLYGVLDSRLSSSKSGYLVGEKCTIADITLYGWVASAIWGGVDIEEFPNLKAWETKMSERPGVVKGRDVPDPYRGKDWMTDPKFLEEMVKKGREWVLADEKE